VNPRTGVGRHGVLTGNAALLVGGGPKWQVRGRIQQPMVGLHTVAGGQYVSHVGAHAPVDPDGPVDPGLDAADRHQAVVLAVDALTLTSLTTWTP
jgi:hypothetical protein